MRKLGTAQTDLTKGIATLAIFLALIAAFKKADVIYRLIAGAFTVVIYVYWYYRRYTFIEDKILSFRFILFFSSSTEILPSSIDQITFYVHGTPATGTYAYIHFRTNGRKDVVAFNFKRDYLFILEFAVLNNLIVDTGGIGWIERAYSDIAARFKR